MARIDFEISGGGLRGAVMDAKASSSTRLVLYWRPANASSTRPSACTRPGS
jgi:hypothetical protein